MTSPAASRASVVTTQEKLFIKRLKILAYLPSRVTMLGGCFAVNFERFQTGFVASDCCRSKISDCSLFQSGLRRTIIFIIG